MINSRGRKNLGIDDKDEGSATAEDHVGIERWIKEIHLKKITS